YAGEHYRVTADLRPRPVQQPRPPVWVAGVVPNRRPLGRARRWDGVVPIGSGEDLTPEQLAAYLALDGQAHRDGRDVVVHQGQGVRAAEDADAGAPWLLRPVLPAQAGWEAELDDIVGHGPDRR